MTADGDAVQVVLDIVHVSGPEPGAEFERILVQGVFPYGAELPPPRAGVIRNVVEVFFGRNMRGVSAFLIETTLAEEETRARHRHPRRRPVTRGRRTAKDTGTWGVIRRFYAAEPRSHTAAEVLAWIEAGGARWDTTAVNRRMAVSSALAKMACEGELVRQERGRYRPPSEGGTA